MNSDFSDIVGKGVTITLSKWQGQPCVHYYSGVVSSAQGAVVRICDAELTMPRDPSVPYTGDISEDDKRVGETLINLASDWVVSVSVSKDYIGVEKD